RATDAAAFRQALRDFQSPVQNVVYADEAGHIAFMAAGLIPIRRTLVDGSQMPVPGDTVAHDWTGFIPFDGLPQGSDPAGGYFATANAKVTDDKYPYFVTARGDSTYRVDRIRQMIEARPKHDLDSMAAMQMDNYSLAAKQIVPLLLAGQPEPLLAGWDLRMTRDAAAPLVFTAWLRELARGLLDDKLAGKLNGGFGAFWFWDAPMIAEALSGGPAAALYGDKDCATQVRAAHERAMKALAAAYGPDPAKWRWGDAHRAHFRNQLYSRLPLLSPLFDLGLRADGDNFTVDRASPEVDDPTGAVFDDIHGASMRGLFDLADLDRSRFIIAGRQSGKLVSSHYADLTPLL